MGYYVSNIFGIRTGGVFSAGADIESMKLRIQSFIKESRKGDPCDPPIGGEACDPSHCMSQELVAGKGSFVVLAGVFNGWRYERSKEFARWLSEEFGVEVLHMCHDEERGEVQCNIWLSGKPLFEIDEDPIGKILRRVC